MENTLLELLNIESVCPSQERVNELIDILSEQLTLKYRYTKENSKFVLFSNYNLLELPEDKEILMITNHFDTVQGFGTAQIVKSNNEYDESWVIGRGAVDDKANTAVMIDLVETINNADKVIIYGITFDEEFDVQGCKQLVETLQELNVKPDNVLLVEATNMCPSGNSSGSVEEGHYWNRLEQKDIENSGLYNKLKEMNMNETYFMTPPCEAGDYKKLGSYVVVCGPGYTDMCHSFSESIEISSLYEWRNRLKWLIENNLK